MYVWRIAAITINTEWISDCLLQTHIYGLPYESRETAHSFCHRVKTNSINIAWTLISFACIVNLVSIIFMSDCDNYRVGMKETKCNEENMLIYCRHNTHYTHAQWESEWMAWQGSICLRTWVFRVVIQQTLTQTTVSGCVLLDNYLCENNNIIHIYLYAMQCNEWLC